MDKPYNRDNAPSPFLNQFQMQQPQFPGQQFQGQEASAPALAAASASTIKPFAANDLAPTAGPFPMAAPGQNPFLDSFKPQAPRADFVPVAPKPAPAAPAPAAQKASIHATPTASGSGAMPRAAAASTAAPRAAATASTIAPRPSPMETARASQILPAKDLLPMIANDQDALPISTTASIDGRSVEECLGVIAVELVIPKDLLFRNPAPYGDLHRIKAAEDALGKVRAKALEELCERARALQADAVIGVAISFSAFDAIVCLCSATGTAVKLS